MADPSLKDMIRDGVRTTIRQTLASVIQEVTEEELQSALKDQSFRGHLTALVQHELQQALEELQSNGRRRKR